MWHTTKTALLTFLLCTFFFCAASQAEESWMSYPDLYGAKQKHDITEAHRTNDEVAAWSMQATANVLSFPFEADLKKSLSEKKKYFVKNGWQGYAQNLKNLGLVGIAQKKDYALVTISNGEAYIMDSGINQGKDAWAWKVRVPVVTSIMQKDPQGTEHTISSTKIISEIEITRTKPETGVDEMVISGWASYITQQ